MSVAAALIKRVQILKEIADSEVKVIIGGAQVGELAMHYLDRMGIAVVKVLSKFDLRRLCRVVNATPLARLGPPTPEEAGWVDVMECTEIGGDRVTVFRQDPDSNMEKSKMSTIVLRGATQNLLDDLERAIDDGVNVLKSLLKDGRLVPGAGATEVELAKRVEAYGAGLRGLSQHSVKRYASALEVVPLTLTENAGNKDPHEVLSELYVKHEKGDTTRGVDIEASSMSLSRFLETHPGKYLVGRRGRDSVDDRCRHIRFIICQGMGFTTGHRRCGLCPPS